MMRKTLCAKVAFALLLGVSGGLGQIITAPAIAAEEVWHASRPLQPGDQLRPSDVAAQPAARGHASRPDLIPSNRDVAGLEVRRRISAGQPLSDRDVGPAYLVRPRQQVRVLYKVGSMTIELAGRALEGGGLGDEVRVHNPSNGRTLRATVIADGTAEVMGTTQR